MDYCHVVKPRVPGVSDPGSPFPQNLEYRAFWFYHEYFLCAWSFVCPWHPEEGWAQKMCFDQRMNKKHMLLSTHPASVIDRV